MFMFMSKHGFLCVVLWASFFMNLHVFLWLGPVSGVLFVALNETSYVSVFTTITKWHAMCYLLHYVNFYMCLVFSTNKWCTMCCVQN